MPNDALSFADTAPWLLLTRTVSHVPRFNVSVTSTFRLHKFSVAVWRGSEGIGVFLALSCRNFWKSVDWCTIWKFGGVSLEHAMLEQESTVDACTSLRVLYQFLKDSAEKTVDRGTSREFVWEFSTGLHRKSQKVGDWREKTSTVQPQQRQWGAFDIPANIASQDVGKVHNLACKFMRATRLTSFPPTGTKEPPLLHMCTERVNTKQPGHMIKGKFLLDRPVPSNMLPKADISRHAHEMSKPGTKPRKAKKHLQPRRQIKTHAPPQVKHPVLSKDRRS